MWRGQSVSFGAGIFDVAFDLRFEWTREEEVEFEMEEGNGKVSGT